MILLDPDAQAHVNRVLIALEQGGHVTRNAKNDTVTIRSKSGVAVLTCAPQTLQAILSMEVRP